MKKAIRAIENKEVLRMGIYFMDGASMTPLLNPDDPCIVDFYDRELGEGLYLMKYGESAVVKRVQPMSTGMIRVSSDNKIYEPEDLSLEEARARILGRVEWIIKEA